MWPPTATTLVITDNGCALLRALGIIPHEQADVDPLQSLNLIDDLIGADAHRKIFEAFARVLVGTASCRRRRIKPEWTQPRRFVPVERRTRRRAMTPADVCRSRAIRNSAIVIVSKDGRRADAVLRQN